MKECGQRIEGDGKCRVDFVSNKSAVRNVRPESVLQYLLVILFFTIESGGNYA